LYTYTSVYTIQAPSITCAEMTRLHAVIVLTLRDAYHATLIKRALHDSSLILRSFYLVSRYHTDHLHDLHLGRFVIYC